MSEDRAQTEDAISALAGQMAYYGYKLNRTKLVKLLYFIDLEAWGDVGRMVTGVRWIWDQHGPFSRAILDACDAMAAADELDVQVEESGSDYWEMLICSKDERYYKRPSDEVVRLIRDVVVRHGAKSATRLKELSYETAPMRRVMGAGQRGDELRFEGPTVSPSQVRETVARYAVLVERQEQAGDVAAALRADIDDFREGRESATEKLLGQV